jgi:5-(hydroxymethyl)furfural/furfural oxidase
MHVAIASRGGWHAVGRRIGAVGFWVNKSYSGGRVRLSASPDKRFDIDFRVLSDPRDMARLKAGFRVGVRAMLAAKQQGAVLDIFPSGFSPRIRELTRPTRRNAVMTAIAAPLMDRSTSVRRQVMTYAVDTQHPAEVLAADDTLLEAHLRRRVGGTWHPCGSCRMGDAADPMAMTDASARVIGVEGLRVCDASLMPTVPCANLNIPVLMIAEKTAATIRAGGWLGRCEAASGATTSRRRPLRGCYKPLLVNPKYKPGRMGRQPDIQFVYVTPINASVWRAMTISSSVGMT